MADELTRDRDFGRTDRYANKDEQQEAEVRNMGDGTSWDSGRESSIGHGTHSENDVRGADAETPGVKTKDADPDAPQSDVNRDE